MKNLHKNGKRSGYLTKEDMQMTSKHMKRYSTSYITRELQIKTTMRYFYTPIKITKIQNTDNLKCWEGCGIAGSFIRCIEDSFLVPSKAKHIVAIQSSDHVPCYLPK